LADCSRDFQGKSIPTTTLTERSRSPNEADPDDDADETKPIPEAASEDAVTERSQFWQPLMTNWGSGRDESIIGSLGGGGLTT